MTVTEIGELNAILEEQTVEDVADGEYFSTDSDWVGMVRSDTEALIAAAFPTNPPLEWFANPKLNSPTPLTVTDDGRVYGHIATWQTSHIGLAGGVKPPRSKSRYAFFATGALKTAEGEMVNVGQITLAGGHAALDASVAEAVAHYDNTNSAIMDVAVGEDDVGIYVAGALRPDVDELRLRNLRASSVSGDWRPINGNLELVAVCAVNVPGFPVPRARVAAGQPIALVAAGTETLAYVALLDRAGIDIRKGIEAGLEHVTTRMSNLESAVIASARTQRRELSEAIRFAKEVQAQTLQADGAVATELRERVHPKVESAVDADVIQQLRSRVRPNESPSESAEAESTEDVESAEETIWTDMMPIEASIADCEQIALRMRVRPTGTLVARAYSSAQRKVAAKKGHANDDGSYPINTVEDLKNAIKAYGRAKDKAKTKALIMRRARALGATNLIPDSWK